MSRAVVEVGSTPAEAPVVPFFLLLERLRPYRHAIGLCVSLVLFALALLACWHLLGSIDKGQVRDALAAVPPRSLLLSALASLAGVVVMIAYEASAARYAQVRLPWRTLALGGFCAFSIGNAVGFSVLSGGSVRYRLYGRLGLGAADVARMTLFASLSLGLCLPVMVAFAALYQPADAARALHISEPVLRIVAIGILLLASAAVGMAARFRSEAPPAPGCWRVELGRLSVRVPGGRLTLAQLLISVLDVGVAASVLYLLLPDAPPFVGFALIYMLALAAGVLSHVPGGVGVFEAVLLAAFAGRLDPAALIAAMLLYRLLYVLLPLCVAGVL